MKTSKMSFTIQNILHVCVIIISSWRSVTCLDLSELRIANSSPVSDDISLKYIPVHRRRRSLSNEPPDEIHAKYNTNSEENTLKLERTQWRQKKVPFHYYHLGVKYEHVADQASDCVSIYTDLESKATALVDFCQVPGRVPQMVIHLTINSTQHAILPDSYDEKHGKVMHKLYQLDEPPAFMGTDYVISSDSFKFEDSGSGRKRRAALTSRHTVELLLVVDFSLFSFWYEKTSGTGRMQKTFELMSAFYAFIVSGVDLRYQEMISEGLNIKVELVEIMAGTTVSDSAWIENHVDPATIGSRGRFDGKAALVDFETWISSMKQTDPTFPKHDSAMLLTARDLVIDDLLGSAGYANLAAICTDKAQAISEDHFNFLSITIITHELGHGLGAVHDGDGNDCLETDRFIMAARNSAMTGPKSRNPWKFSSCSVTSIKELLTSLNQNEAENCLISNDNLKHIQSTGKKLGQRYNPDKQCQLSNADKESVFCKAFHIGVYDKICTGIWCSVNAVNCSLVIPADGTTCGNKKWCINGQCVYSNDAPDADETCLFGDQLGEISKGKTCSSIVESAPETCYRELFRSPCCTSCAKAHTNVNGCEYGDRQNCSIINAARCYDQDIEVSSCCKTCKQFKRDDLPASCAYGDKAINCVTNEIVCEQFPDECCDTCKDMLNVSATSSSSQTTPASTQSTGASTVSQGTTAETEQPTTSADSNDLEDWVIPVAASVGGVLLLALLSGVTCCCKRSNRRPKDKYRYRNYNRKNNSRKQHLGDSRAGPSAYDFYGISDAAYNNPATGYYGGNVLRY